ncbi:MAG TPA: matrixin family metalloprotease [Candidatus Thermoplasmatota archaeon]|nr:matrixin family metalloprotease [Candidatus Thermoplasmatota archaeon]
MQLKVVLAGLVALGMLTGVAGAFEFVLYAPEPDCDRWTAEELAENAGVMVDTYPTLDPEVTVTVHMLCPYVSDLGLDALTDCPATDYSLTGWKWNSAYSGKLDTSNPYGLSASGLLKAFNDGSEAWDARTGADIFGSITSGGLAKNVGRGDGINQHGFKKGGNYVAVTYTWSSGGRAIESDAGYNTFYPWSLTGESNKMDVLNVQVHEIGHTFGMGHTSTASVNSCQTMYPYVDYGETQKRTLADGDIIGLRAIYGN